MKLKSFCISLLLIALLPSLINANTLSLIGKRYFNISYGLSHPKETDTSISLARLSMNIPITNKLDLGFGSFHAWLNEPESQSEISEHTTYSFFTNLKYHFLPNAIINPCAILEIGQVIDQIKSNQIQGNSSAESSGLIVSNKYKFSDHLTAINYYYQIALGEEFKLNDKTSFSMFFSLGSLDNSEYQHFSANIGHWILRDLFLDFQYKTHINRSINEFHLVSYVRF
jgi:hypothetical protein